MDTCLERHLRRIRKPFLPKKMSQTKDTIRKSGPFPGWPDIANFRQLDDCLLWATIENYSSTEGVKLCINFDKKMVGLHFGRFFQKRIWSPWLFCRFLEENGNFRPFKRIDQAMENLHNYILNKCCFLDKILPLIILYDIPISILPEL
jgi:hypothetical protein